MGITKTMSLKKGDDYFNISGVFSERKLIPDLSASYWNNDGEKNQRTLNLKTNEEIINLFKKLTDFMYWDILQFEADKGELTNLLSSLFSKNKIEEKVENSEYRILNRSDKLKIRKQFALMNHSKFRGNSSKMKY